MGMMIHRHFIDGSKVTNVNKVAEESFVKVVNDVETKKVEKPTKSKK